MFSFELNSGHQQVARRNLSCWASSWDLARQTKWPDNVSYYSAGVQEAQSYLEEQDFDAVSVSVMALACCIPNSITTCM